MDESTFLLISGEIRPGLRTRNVKSIAFAGGSIEWRQLPDLPKPSGDALQEGVAGAYAGSVGDAVLVAGGANFRGARGRAEAGRWFAHEGLAKSWRTETTHGLAEAGRKWASFLRGLPTVRPLVHLRVS